MAARRMLLVSYWYPPAVGAAAERVASFARCLPSHGWEVHVLTARREPTASFEPGVVLHEAPDPWASRPVVADYDPRVRPPAWRRYLREFIFPDRFLGWRNKAKRLWRKSLSGLDFDVMLVSFPPASAVQAALFIHTQSRVPLIVDFRDRWIGPGGYEPKRARARAAHEELQRRAVGAAAGLVAVSDAMAEALSAEHDCPRDRIMVLPNGYDDAVVGPKNPVSTSPLRIVHVGTVIPRNRPDLFFNSVLELRKAERLKDVRFQFVGNLSRRYLRDVGLDACVETTGLVPREAARQEMESAPALLLLVGRYVGRWGHNAKLFEYIRSGRPILCLEETPGSGDAEMLRRFAPQRSFFARLGDAPALVAAVEAVREYVNRCPQSARELPPEFARYSRSNLAGELARWLECGMKGRGQGA